jgi:hypothetical protein
MTLASLIQIYGHTMALLKRHDLALIFAAEEP